jgi:hypothetical protein
MTTKTKRTPKAERGPRELPCSFAASAELKAKLEAIARKEERSLSFIVRRAVEEYLSKPPRAPGAGVSSPEAAA